LKNSHSFNITSHESVTPYIYDIKTATSSYLNACAGDFMSLLLNQKKDTQLNKSRLDQAKRIHPAVVYGYLF